MSEIKLQDAMQYVEKSFRDGYPSSEAGKLVDRIERVSDATDQYIPPAIVVALAKTALLSTEENLRSEIVV